MVALTSVDKVSQSNSSSEPSDASSAAEASIQIKGLYKTFRRQGGATVNAVDNISLEIQRGHMLVLLGPSGCGKTTLLRCIAGLEQPEDGDITVDGRLHFSKQQSVNRAPNKRNISMMFQSYALWPHMTVGKNVAYSLHGQRLSKQQTEERVDKILETVGLPGLAHQYPGQLSGGQQQRVALARSLVTNPSVILFDEPLSNVDAKVREELRVELMTKQKELGFTGVYVTHDQVEAMQLADRLAVLDSGKVAQIDRPEVVYSNPASLKVARFVGTLNELQGTVKSVEQDGSVIVDTALGTLRGRDPGSHLSSATAGTAVVIGIRAEAIHLTAVQRAPGDANKAKGSLVTSGFAGAYSVQVLEVNGSTITLHSEDLRHHLDLPRPGDETQIWIEQRDVMVFPS